MGFQWPDYTLAEANVDWVPGGDNDDDNVDGDGGSPCSGKCLGGIANRD